MRVKKEVNAFEYLFGLGKYLVAKYDMLRFNFNLPDDAINTIAYEIVNACLNNSDKISTLYKNIYSIVNINSFEKALCKSIEFVNDSIAVITRFKGNMRTGTKLFHSKYQIISMISTAFRAMFKEGNYNCFADSWNDMQHTLSLNFKQYYVYDIITNEWSAGGTQKVYVAGKRYVNEISPRAWRTALDGFFDRSMERIESKQIANPRSGEYVILNCIYLNTFTAMDQLSIDKFDVEHIAPKEQMRRLISDCHGSGLPISCIANLCYLPEYANRSKQDKNFYQDTKYLQKINVTLDDIEKRFSFTQKEDLEWMDIAFQSQDDFDLLKRFYTEFCTTRFTYMKKLFCASMKIDYEAMVAVAEDEQNTSNESESCGSSDKEYYRKCAERIEKAYHLKLKKIRTTAYKTDDNQKGYIICLSKAYTQGNRQRYWFGYHRDSLKYIEKCTDKYIVFCLKNTNEILCIPVSTIEESLSKLIYSKKEDGEISHWHIHFFRDSNGNMTQLYSYPNLEEISVNHYKV